jgi:hypothetical protein
MTTTPEPGHHDMTDPTPLETYEQVPKSDEHPDDVEPEPEDDNVENDEEESEDDFEDLTDDDLADGAEDPGDEPVIDPDPDDETEVVAHHADGTPPTEHPGYSSGGLS